MGGRWGYQLNARFREELLAVHWAEKQNVMSCIMSMIENPRAKSRVRRLPFPSNGQVFAATFPGTIVHFEIDNEARSIVFTRLFTTWKSASD